MSPDAQFWWNWAIYATTATATTLAVVVAIWGEKIRHRLLRPSLRLSLVSHEGELTNTFLNPPDAFDGKPVPLRVYHVRVSNPDHRWLPIRDVMVHLLELWEPGPDGFFQRKWVGAVPLRFRHYETMSAERTVGADADADLCAVVKGKWFYIPLLVAPNNLDTRRAEKMRMRVMLQARGVEADSGARYRMGRAMARGCKGDGPIPHDQRGHAAPTLTDTLEMRYVWNIIPDAQTVIDIGPEELGLVVLRALNARTQDWQFHPFNFANEFESVACTYPAEKRPDVRTAILESWGWLLSQNLIASTGDSTPWAFVTRRGDKIRTEQAAIDYRKAAALPFHLLHPQLAAAVRGPFLRGEYDTAVFVSFRTVEEAVRAAGGYKGY